MNNMVEYRGAALESAVGRFEVSEVVGHSERVRQAMASVMKNGVDYGVIKGTPKPTLYKPGAEKLCMTFRIADEYNIEDLSDGDVIRYRVACIGRHQVTNAVLGAGMGAASSGEEKYKWRRAVCPEEFNDTPPDRKREKWIKPYQKPAYKVQQVRTEALDLDNTVLKMACKRAKIAMVLAVTAASDVFTQDIEDLSKELQDHIVNVESDTGGAEDNALPAMSDEDFKAKVPKWHAAIAKAVAAGKPLAEAATYKINQISTAYTLTDEQKQAIGTLPKAEAKAETKAPIEGKAEPVTTDDDILGG